MTAPLRTSAQFLVESGFGQYGADKLNFPEYPDLDAQLQALRKLDPTAREISWIEYALGRAREARLVDEHRQEQSELAVARRNIEQSFKRRTPQGSWTKIAVVLAAIALAAVLIYLDQRKKKRRRRQNVGLDDDPYDPTNDPHGLPAPDDADEADAEDEDDD